MTPSLALPTPRGTASSMGQRGVGGARGETGGCRTPPFTPQAFPGEFRARRNLTRQYRARGKIPQMAEGNQHQIRYGIGRLISLVLVELGEAQSLSSAGKKFR